MDKNIKRLMDLYPGLERSRGIWYPNTGGMNTTKERPDYEDFEQHINGEYGLGIVPINDQGTCMWGAIDVDTIPDRSPENLDPLLLKIQEFGMPLVMCLSKSKGVHLYCFFKEPIKASIVQGTLNRWAATLGYAGVEVFPKQRRLSPTQMGNWINLPYFNLKDTDRYAYHSNKRLEFEEFLDLAESLKVGLTKLREIDVPEDLREAAPCVAHMLTHGIDQGYRNNAMFAIGTYFRKRGDNDIEESLTRVNHDKAIMLKPLSKRELSTVAKSASRENYAYRCNEPPIVNICDRETCVTRKFGVGSGGPTEQYDLPLWGSLTKVNSDPPRWLFEVNGMEIEFTTEELMTFKAVQRKLFECIDLVVPMMKDDQWLPILKQKMQTKADITAPDDASPGAMIRALLDDFTATAERYDSDNKPVYGKREDLNRGLPVLELSESGPVILFRGQDFIMFLKKKRAEEMKGAALWSILRKIGCTHEKMRVGGKARQVWVRPVVLTQINYPIAPIKEAF